MLKDIESISWKNHYSSYRWRKINPTKGHRKSKGNLEKDKKVKNGNIKI